jgi:predicted acylesterase/phospholipase RssA
MDAIAFEGCACRAAFHAGVAAALGDASWVPPLAAGASSGAIIATALAALPARELPARWRAFGGRSVLSLRRMWQNRSPFDMSHLVRSAVGDVLAGRDLRSSRVEALVVATRLRDLSTVVYSSREEHDFVEVLMGSCFIPVLYGRTVRYRGTLLVDGGLTNNLPLEALAARGARDIIAVTVRPDGTAFKNPRRRTWRPAVDGARVHVIAPRAPLPIGSWDFDPDRLARTLDVGYARGREFLGS